MTLFGDEGKQDRPGNGLVGHNILKPRSHHKSESYFLVTAQTRQVFYKSHTVMHTHTELYVRYLYSTNQNNTKEYGCQRRDKISILEKWQNLIREWKKGLFWTVMNTFQKYWIFLAWSPTYHNIRQYQQIEEWEKSARRSTGDIPRKTRIACGRELQQIISLASQSASVFCLVQSAAEMQLSESHTALTWQKLA